MLAPLMPKQDTAPAEPSIRAALDKHSLQLSFLDNLFYVQGKFPALATTQRLLPGAGLRGARPHAAALDQHRGGLHQAGLAHGRLSVGRVPDGSAPRQQSHQSRHLRQGQARRSRSWASISRNCWRRKRNRGSATAAWAGWRPASSIRWRRWRCPRSATASATSSASSIRRSSTAGRSSTPTNGCASAIPGRSSGRSGRWR